MSKFRFAKVTTWAITITILAIIWLGHPMIAYAQGTTSTAPDPTTSPVGELLMMVLKIVFSILGVVGTFLTTKAIQYFQKKTNIAIPQATEEMLLGWADHAIAFAYEKAHQVLQQTGKTLDGNAKLNIAVQFILDLVQKHGIDNVVEEKIKNYIEAKLGAMRMDNGGAPVPVTPSTTPTTTTTAPANETVVVAK